MRSRPPSQSPLAPERVGLFLDDGSRVAVIGGGPAGSFFTYFLFEMAERIGMELAVDIYEPRDFTKTAPHGCNMCGGILSESLVQLLATEGINLPPTVVQRGIKTSMGALPAGWKDGKKEDKVPFGKMGELGKVYAPGEIIVRQGDVGECMYFIQSGKVEVIHENDGNEVKLAELGHGEFFGEMALFEKGIRSATVRPLGEVRVLSVDKKLFLKKIHEDPGLAFRIMQKMSRRIRDLDKELGILRSE